MKIQKSLFLILLFFSTIQLNGLSQSQKDESIDWYLKNLPVKRFVGGLASFIVGAYLMHHSNSTWLKKIEQNGKFVGEIYGKNTDYYWFAKRLALAGALMFLSACDDLRKKVTITFLFHPQN
jgi:hypothetical protein